MNTFVNNTTKTIAVGPLKVVTNTGTKRGITRNILRNSEKATTKLVGAFDAMGRTTTCANTSKSNFETFVNGLSQEERFTKGLNRSLKDVAKSRTLDRVKEEVNRKLDNISEGSLARTSPSVKKTNNRA